MEKEKRSREIVFAGSDNGSCLIIGGGYSIKKQGQTEKIKASPLFKIGCNKVFETFNIDCLSYFDFKWERENRERIKALKCEKYAPETPCYEQNHFTDLGTKYFKSSRIPSLDQIFTGCNSGTQAISIAITKKYKEIFLFGCDCNLIEGKSHYHGGYGIKMVPESYETMIWYFEIVGRFAKANGIKIWNCSEDSLLDRDIFEYYEGFNG